MKIYSVFKFVYADLFTFDKFLIEQTLKKP